MQFRKKPVVIEAVQWFKLGDHPAVEDPCKVLHESQWGLFGSPESDTGTKACTHCGGSIYVHGWVHTLEHGHFACPGDWIITGIKGERYPCKPKIFEETYEQV